MKTTLDLSETTVKGLLYWYKVWADLGQVEWETGADLIHEVVDAAAEQVALQTALNIPANEPENRK